MASVSRDMLQRIAHPGGSSVEDAVRTVRGNIITSAGRGQRWWREEVFETAVGRGAVTTATVGAVQEALFRCFPDVTVRFIYETHGGRMRRILEIDWS